MKQNIEQLKSAAEDGDAKAMYELANMYENGIGVLKNEELACELYLKAAAQDNSYFADCDNIFVKNAKPKPESAPLQFTPIHTYRYLQEHIEDFYVPQEIWQHISEGFRLYWNIEASVGGYYDNIYCRESIQSYLEKQGIAFPVFRLQIIVNHILDYADMCTAEIDEEDYRIGDEVVLIAESLSDLAPDTYDDITNILDHYSVLYQSLDNTNNIWLRDFMPIELPAERYATYRYNPDYLRNFKCHQDEIVDWKDYIGSLCLDIDDDLKDIIIDGGNVVRCGDYVVMTAKVFEENPTYSHSELTSLIEKTLKARLIVLPWDTKEIFGHADGILRYVGDNTVLLTNYRQFDPKMADRFVNCLKPYFKIKELSYNVKHLDNRSWAYINWLQTENVLIIPKLNIPEDEQALRQITAAFPGYSGLIEMADARDLVAMGGGFNCCTWVYKK